MDIDLPPPPATDLVVDIKAEDVALFREQGYLTCTEISPPEELAWLNEVYDWFLNQPRSGFLDGVFDLVSAYGTTEAPKVGQLLFPEQKLPALAETSLWRNARRIATQLLGVSDEKIENWGHLIYKAPHCENVTPWHQDEAYWDVSNDYDALGSWVPLQPVDESNGCLWFLPGSHKAEVFQHRHFGDDPAVHILEVTESINTGNAVAIPLAAGAVSFHHPRLLHYAGPNPTSCIRKAWANEFQAPPVRRDRPYDRPWVKAGQEEMARRLKAR